RLIVEWGGGRGQGGEGRLCHAGGCRADVPRVDRHGGGGRPRPEKLPGAVPRPPQPTCVAFPSALAGLDIELYIFHGSLYTNKELIDSSLWMRRIASPMRWAIERTRILSSACASGRRGIELVTTSSSSTDSRRRAIAGPESTGWVQQANTACAPASWSAAAAVVRVPAVSTISSTRTVTRPSTSPMMCISATSRLAFPGIFTSSVRARRLS